MLPDLTKPDEALAHYLSEWLNDSAPIGWRKYLPCAKDMIAKNMTPSPAKVDDGVVERVARAIHDHWQGNGHSASRPWAQTVEKLPNLAEDFRHKACTAAAMEGK